MSALEYRRFGRHRLDLVHHHYLTDSVRAAVKHVDVRVANVHLEFTVRAGEGFAAEYATISTCPFAT